MLPQTQCFPNKSMHAVSYEWSNNDQLSDTHTDPALHFWHSQICTGYSQAASNLYLEGPRAKGTLWRSETAIRSHFQVITSWGHKIFSLLLSQVKRSSRFIRLILGSPCIHLVHYTVSTFLSFFVSGLQSWVSEGSWKECVLTVPFQRNTQVEVLSFIVRHSIQGSILLMLRSLFKRVPNV